MDFVGPFVGLIDDYLFATLVRQINYLRRPSANVNDMQAAVRKLIARRDDNQSTLKNSGQVETKEASNWFNDVEAIKKEADAIELEYNERVWCVNCCLDYRSSKRSIDLQRKAEGCFNEQFVLARQPSPEPAREMESEPIENQPSTLRTLQKILGCIDDPEFGIIGIYGMGGVVSATPDIHNIQTGIGRRLGLDLSNAAEDDAKEKLYDALKKKKFLLILDDVWHKLELKDVGIPHPRNHKRNSKILLTSRSQDACTDMDAEITVKVEPLSSDESWSLFVKKAGQHVTADDRIECSAKKIVGRCKGLPLAIVTVARAMVNRRGVGVWDNAAREMEQSVTDLRGMKEEVLVPLKFSFDRLDDDMLRGLFLYCSCFPEDYILSGGLLLYYCVGEGFIDRLGSLTYAKNKGEALTESLKIACMLEDGGFEGWVRMHDMMRELAIWINSSLDSDGSPKFLLRTGKLCKEAPHVSEWVDAKHISLINTEIKELPELEERCRKLTTLMLRENGVIHAIPPTNFLQHMDHLSILDLFRLEKLEYLPDSLSCLVNLQVLSVQFCRNLRALPTLGMLRRLQILSLFGCDMLEQPIFGSKCLGGISNLSHLNVSLTKICIQPGVISRLVKMEELCLQEADNIRWKVSAVEEENEKWDGRDCDDEEGNKLMNEESIDIRELFHLTHLTTIGISFKDLIISDWFNPLVNKIDTLTLERCTIIKQDVIQALNEAQKLVWLEFRNCLGLKCVPTVPERYLYLKECKELEKLLDGAEEADQDSFHKLKKLDLISLPKLERICVGLAPPNCFAQLFELQITCCNRLKMVFTKGMPRSFNNLSEIYLNKCERLEVIIEGEEEKDGEVLMEGRNSNTTPISPFPKLTYLWLVNLPALTDVCSHRILHCPLLKEMVASNCPRLKKDPLHIRNTDGLLVIKGQKWDGEVLKGEIREI